VPYRLSPKTRAKAERTVVVALESDVREKRHLAAQAQLSHRLRNSFQRIDDRRQIDLEYLTCAEYQLFLDEMSDQGEWFQPDHWTNQRFAAGQSRQPLKGVRPEDAEEFCRWLTQQQGGSARYRLPSRDEAIQYPTAGEKMAAWCRDSGEFSLVGLAPADIEEIVRECEALFDERLPSLSLLDVNRHREALMFERTLLRSWTLTEVAAIMLAIVLVVAVFIFAFSYSVLPLIIIGVLVAIWVSIQSDNEGLMVGLMMMSMCMVMWLLLSYPLYTLPLVVVALSLFSKRFRGFLARLVGKAFSDSAVLRALRKRQPGSRPTGEFEYEVVDSRKPDEGRLKKRRLADEAVTRTKSTGLFARWRRKLGFHRTAKIERQKGRSAVHWWLRLIIAREEGDIPAWEGIRLVREL
jgi:hypothetical protein